MNGEKVYTIPRPPADDALAQHRHYLAVGREAVRRWLTENIGSASPARHWAALRIGRVDEGVVRFWVLEDLFADPTLELAARKGYPQLAPEFERLQRERNAARERDDAQFVRRAVEEAMAGFDWEA